MTPDAQNTLRGACEALQGHRDRLQVIYAHLGAVERSGGPEAWLRELDRLAPEIFKPL